MRLFTVSGALISQKGARGRLAGGADLASRRERLRARRVAGLAAPCPVSLRWSPYCRKKMPSVKRNGGVWFAIALGKGPFSETLL